MTNHAIVLATLASDPDLTLRSIADRTGLTERAVHRIVTDLVDKGYLLVRRVGRRNQYQVVSDVPFRHPGADPVPVGALLDLLRGG